MKVVKRCREIHHLNKRVAKLETCRLKSCVFVLSAESFKSAIFHKTSIMTFHLENFANSFLVVILPPVP